MVSGRRDGSAENYWVLPGGGVELKVFFLIFLMTFYPIFLNFKGKYRRSCCSRIKGRGWNTGSSVIPNWKIYCKNDFLF